MLYALAATVLSSSISLLHFRFSSITFHSLFRFLQFYLIAFFFFLLLAFKCYQIVNHRGYYRDARSILSASVRTQSALWAASPEAFLGKVNTCSRRVFFLIHTY